MHGYKTFILCLLVLVGYFVVALVQHHVVTGGDLAYVVAAVAALYGVNDAAGGIRELARRPKTPSTVATADTIDVHVGEAG